MTSDLDPEFMVMYLSHSSIMNHVLNMHCALTVNFNVIRKSSDKRGFSGDPVNCSVSVSYLLLVSGASHVLKRISQSEFAPQRMCHQVGKTI